MPATRKTPSATADAVATSVSPKTVRKGTPRKTPAAKPVVPDAVVPAPVVQAVGTEPAVPKRKRLAKAFSRPLDKILMKKSDADVPAPREHEKSSVRDDFKFPRAERDVLVDLKKQLIAQGVAVKKSDLIRVGLILVSSLSAEKLKSMLAKLPPVR